MAAGALWEPLATGWDSQLAGPLLVVVALEGGHGDTEGVEDGGGGAGALGEPSRWRLVERTGEGGWEAGWEGREGEAGG